MTKEEFSNEMGRLVQQFGKTAYSPARIEIIAKAVSDLDASWWRQTVDRFLGECRQAPLMPEVKDAISRERERIWQARKVIPINEIWNNRKVMACTLCNGTGAVRAYRTDVVTGIYAFLCDCESGRMNPRNFPTWESADKNLFEPLTGASVVGKTATWEPMP